MVDVERWAELRREHFVKGVGGKELVRRKSDRTARRPYSAVNKVHPSSLLR